MREAKTMKRGAAGRGARVAASRAARVAASRKDDVADEAPAAENTNAASTDAAEEAGN